jgi:hypothetical protein
MQCQAFATVADGLVSADRLGFRSRDIIQLTDEAHDTRHLPTRQNIISALRWLVRGAHKHDSLFFHCVFVPEAQSEFIDAPS